MKVLQPPSYSISHSYRVDYPITRLCSTIADVCRYLTPAVVLRDDSVVKGNALVESRQWLILP